MPSARSPRRAAAGRSGRGRSRSRSWPPARRPRRARARSRRGAGPRPSLRSRWRTSRKPTSAASRSASFPSRRVTRRRSRGRERPGRGRSGPRRGVRTMGSRFSRSSYVGRQTMRFTRVSSPRCPRSCRRTPSWPSASSSLPTCWSSTARTRSDLPPTDAQPRASASRPSPWRSSPSTGRRHASPGSAGRSRARSWRSSRPAT